jgi:hypothetical protein
MTTIKRFKVKKLTGHFAMRTESRGLTLECLSFTVKTKNAFDLILNKFKPDLSVACTYGAGLLAYNGFCSEDSNVFLGFCDSLQRGVVKFCHENSTAPSMKQLLKFLASSEFSQNIDDFAVTGIDCCLNLDCPPSIKSESDYTQVLQNTVKAQKKKSPKVYVSAKNELVVGTKSSGNNLIITGIKGKNSEIVKLSVQAKLAETSTNSILNTIKDNPNVNMLDIVAYFLDKSLSKITSTDFLSMLTTLLIRSHNISAIKDISQTKSKLKSKDATAASRSLSTVRNKLVNKEISQEIQETFMHWFEELMTTYKPKIVNYDNFIVNIQGVLDKAKPAVPSATSKTRST